MALTASAVEQAGERCLCVGMNGFPAKPVNLGMLGAVFTQYR